MHQEVQQMLDGFIHQYYIANLGHGAYPDKARFLWMR